MKPASNAGVGCASGRDRSIESGRTKPGETPAATVGRHPPDGPRLVGVSATPPAAAVDRDSTVHRASSAEPVEALFHKGIRLVTLDRPKS